MFELISETEYRETMENTVEPQLAAIREELSMPLEDGGVLHRHACGYRAARLHGERRKIPRNDVVFPAIGFQRLRHRPSRPRQKRAVS